MTRTARSGTSSWRRSRASKFHFSPFLPCTFLSYLLDGILAQVLRGISKEETRAWPERERTKPRCPTPPHPTPTHLTSAVSQHAHITKSTPLHSLSFRLALSRSMLVKDISPCRQKYPSSRTTNRQPLVGGTGIRGISAFQTNGHKHTLPLEPSFPPSSSSTAVMLDEITTRSIQPQLKHVAPP